jgi:hypothetical protein
MILSNEAEWHRFCTGRSRGNEGGNVIISLRAILRRVEFLRDYALAMTNVRNRLST